ncbi:hypothetical protein [Bradyrhizobium sp. SEMIA]|uniref:hypothetical protein n=1 Tax=Bradyrhizobium sp. SEMIA TaxID=2597515 RepID=UPI00223F19EF|nr:hypothetical protein [Bradyrhizobium sp. SEMIA]
MNGLARVLASAAALMLGGCGSVPLTSIPPLARIDARTTDLSMLRVAVQLPDALRSRSGGVKLDVVTKLAGEAEAKTSFAMMELSARERGGLPAQPLLHLRLSLVAGRCRALRGVARLDGRAGEER